MEPTVCPWCQSEIVWDEELGPEEHCPHCANELKGYRTLNIDLNDDEEYTEHSDEEAYEASEEEEQELHSMWGSDTESLAALRTVDKYGESMICMRLNRRWKPFSTNRTRCRNVCIAESTCFTLEVNP